MKRDALRMSVALYEEVQRYAANAEKTRELPLAEAVQRLVIGGSNILQDAHNPDKIVRKVPNNIHALESRKINVGLSKRLNKSLDTDCLAFLPLSKAQRIRMLLWIGLQAMLHGKEYRYEG